MKRITHPPPCHPLVSLDQFPVLAMPEEGKLDEAMLAVRCQNAPPIEKPIEINLHSHENRLETN